MTPPHGTVGFSLAAARPPAIVTKISNYRKEKMLASSSFLKEKFCGSGIYLYFNAV